MQTKKDIYCFICPSHCALKATFDENGKMTKVIADSRSGQHCDICDSAKGPNTIPEAHSHGKRLQFPMKRAGERGRNQWIRITWDEALDTIAEKMKFYRDTYPLINEGARILEEGISYRAGDIDIVWMNGYGFSSLKGGPMHTANVIGLKELAARLDHHAAQRGNTHEYWTAAKLLRDRAAAGQQFSDA